MNLSAPLSPLLSNLNGASLAGFVVSFAFLLKPIMPRTMKEKRARQKERARQEDASNKEGQEELKKAFEAGESLG